MGACHGHKPAEASSRHSGAFQYGETLGPHMRYSSGGNGAQNALLFYAQLITLVVLSHRVQHTKSACA